MPRAAAHRPNPHKPVILVIGLVIVGYMLATLAGWTIPTDAVGRMPNTSRMPPLRRLGR